MPKESPRKRIKIKGHYMQVRQRPSEKGKKGTIMAKWTSSKKGKKRTYRCKLPISRRLQTFCGRRKAGSQCLKGEDQKSRCPQLVTAYQ